MADEIKVKGLAITEADREFSKEFPKYGTFSIRIPLPYQKNQIIALTSRLLGGASLESIRREDYEYSRMIATLDFVTIKKPDGWSAGECPDDSLLTDLWKFFVDSEKKFDEFLKKV